MKFVLLFIALSFVQFSLQQTATTPAGGGTVATAATAAATTGATQCPYPPLLGEVPSLFNVWIFENFMTTDADIGGRLAVGGDAELLGTVNVGTSLPLAICPAEGENATSAPPTNATATQTEWFDNVIVGGMLTWSNGQLSSGNIIVGTNSSVSDVILTGLQQPCSLKQNATRLNFTFWEEYLTDLSSRLGSLSATSGAATLQNGVLTIPAPSSSGGVASRQITEPGAENEDQLEVVDVNAPDLLSATQVTLSTSTSAVPTAAPPATTPAGTAVGGSGGPYRRQVATAAPPATTPAGTTPVAGTTPSGTSGQEQQNRVWLFNVRGSPCGFNNPQLQDFQQLGNRIIWNFVDCDNLTISGASNASAIYGSILAPNATVMGGTGLVYGQLIARNYNGSLNFNNTLFEGCVEEPPAGTAGTQATSFPAGTAVPGTAVAGTVQQGTVVARNVPWYEEDESENGTAVVSIGYFALLLLAMVLF